MPSALSEDPSIASSELRFFCDEMLKRLGRWLRAAGYDTLIQESPNPDRIMLRTALREGRLLVTRDHKLMEFRNAANSVILLRSNGLTESVQELSRRVRIDWLYRPFTRCLICNSVLEKASTVAWGQVPSDSRAHIDELFFCSNCTKPYWEGGHVRRMRKRLAQWQIESR